MTLLFSFYLFIGKMKILSSLGGAKNYRYQRYFVPYKICIVEPPCFYGTNRKPLKRAF